MVGRGLRWLGMPALAVSLVGAYARVLPPASPPEPAPAPAFDPAAFDQEVASTLALSGQPGRRQEWGHVRCLTATCGPAARELWVDYQQLGLSFPLGGEWLAYDAFEVTRPVAPAWLASEGELSLAVRVLLSEVGPDRLLTNRYGLLEAIGILYTLDNRLQAEGYNPQFHPKAPVFPGCGETGALGSCANGQQYNGMATRRALDPGAHFAPALLEPGTDLAVLAWWLQDNGYVADFTQGATSFVHRCGGAGYGKTTHHCDGHLGRPERDLPGAEPHTGPTVFRAQAAFHPRKGYYTQYESVWVEFDPWWSEIDQRQLRERPLTRRPARFQPDEDRLQPVFDLVERLGPTEDEGAQAILASAYANRAAR